GLALDAINMIVSDLPIAYSKKDDLESLSNVMLASTMAGMAFSESGVALVHSISHTVSSHFNVPHGLANAVILPYVVEFNLLSEPEKYLKIFDIFEEKHNLIYSNGNHTDLPETIRNFTKKLGIPPNFSYLNITLSDEKINQLCLDAMDDKGTFPKNSRKAEFNDVKNLIVKLFE